jgi:hypothetical protein
MKADEATYVLMPFSISEPTDSVLPRRATGNRIRGCAQPALGGTSPFVSTINPVSVCKRKAKFKSASG